MSTSKQRKLMAFVLAVLMVGTLAVGSCNFGINAKAVTQEEIDELQAQADSISAQKAELQSEIDSLTDDRNVSLAKKAVLDEQVMLTQQEIDNIQKQIEVYSELIDEKADEVVAAQEKEEAQLQEYRSRVQSMEENGSISYLAVLFDASSFSDFLSRLDFIYGVMTYDEQLYQSYIEAKEATIVAKQELETAKAGQEKAKADEETKKAELEDQVAQAQAYIAGLEDSIDTSQTYYDDLSASQSKIAAEIAEKEAELEAQRIAEEEARRKAEEERLAKEEAERLAAEQAAAANNGNSGSSGNTYTPSYSGGGGGSFIWPAPSSYCITSLFGYRYHPITGVYKYHAGIDIGAGYGEYVVAASSGTVLSAYYDSGYGNFVTISHGDGYVTLYAHMSAFAVSAGDYVSQGDVIGYVGSTGASTGPHCHFEVYYNDAIQDPLDYLSGYSYYISE